MSQRVVITGGAGHLAQAISRDLRAAFCEVLAPDKVQLDIARQSSITAYFENREVDLLICAAGKIHDAPLKNLTEKNWDDLWSVNFVGAQQVANHVLPAMEKNRCGHIIFISSFSAIHPPIGQVPYACAKAALIGLTHALAKQYGKSQIRINAIMPGFLDTPMTRAISAKRRAAILTNHALGNFNRVENVASFIRNLHFEMPFTSGQVFNLDSRII
ncbi:MAG: SDR family NAD(P)-dependent oxidoreductase [Verrucomicrobia bacterium]|nr:MAG: SDR family NAD(P)-dependent oxidoreductase [Verrucomicrobiota bacterium]